MRDHSEIDGRLKLADLLVHDSRHFPGKVAVRFETGEMTYGQLASSVDKLARHEYPREIEFIDQLPTTATGKVMRRVLKEREKAKLADH